MNVRFDPDVDAFLKHAAPTLEAHEDTASLVLGICHNLTTGRTYGDRPPLFASVSDGGEARVFAVRTPPHNLVLFAKEGHPVALEALAERLHAKGHRLPGCHGTSAVAEAFARAWCRVAGCVSVVAMRQKVFRLDTVTPPRPAPGHLRPAEEADIEWLVEWATAFHREAVPGDPDRDQRRVVDWMLAQRNLWVWEDDRPVSLCAAMRPTAHGIAIGLVYTPPEDRGSGYASNCVAAVSQRLLDQGYAFCTLFTDLSNPTSNKIYQAIGYRPLAEFRRIDFRDASG